MRRQRTPLVAMLALALAAPPAARGQVTYSYTAIARTGGGQFVGLYAPALNATGTAAFGAILPGNAQGIFTGAGGAVTTVAQTGTTFSGFIAPLTPSPPIIVSITPGSNTVAFFATRTAAAGGGAGIFAGNGGPVTTVAGTGPTFSDVGLGPGINTAGTVAFAAALTAGGQGIFAGNGGPVTPVVTSGPTFTNFAPFASINATGTAAFNAGLAAGGAGIFTSNGATLTTIATTGPTAFSAFAGPTDINATGRVAFVGTLADGRQGVFAGSGGPLTTVAATGPGSPFANFGTFASIDPAGGVTFAANLTAGGQGIFTGPDPVANKVIRTGDALDGSTVTAVAFGTGAVNGLGQVGFVVQLADGRQGVYVATPVPEPAGALAVMAAAAGLAGAARRWRGRRPVLVPPAAGGVALRFLGHAECDPVEPTGQRPRVADGGRVAGQDQERRLEGVLGVLLVAQHAPADAQDQRPVPADERGKGGLVAAGAEGVQQRAVGRPGGGAGGQGPDVPDDRFELGVGHAYGPRGGGVPEIVPCRRESAKFFSKARCLYRVGLAESNRLRPAAVAVVH